MEQSIRISLTKSRLAILDKLIIYFPESTVLLVRSFITGKTQMHLRADNYLHWLWAWVNKLP